MKVIYYINQGKIKKSRLFIPEKLYLELKINNLINKNIVAYDNVDMLFSYLNETKSDNEQIFEIDGTWEEIMLEISNLQNLIEII